MYRNSKKERKLKVGGSNQRRLPHISYTGTSSHRQTQEKEDIPKIKREEGVDMDWKRVGGALNPDLRSNSVGGSNQGRLPHISYTGQGHQQPTFKP